MSTHDRKLSGYVLVAIIALALCVIGFYQARQVRTISDTFLITAEGWQGQVELRQEWRGRILTNVLAGALTNFAQARHGFTDPDQTLAWVGSFWTLGWLLLIFGLLIALLRERALLYVFGIFAAISFGYTADLGLAVLTPYELPALLVFACFVALVMLHRLEWLLVLVPVGALFKETALVLPVAFLFAGHMSLRRRVGFALATFAGAVLLKGVVDVATGNPSPIVTMTSEFAGTPLWLRNFQELLQLRLNHPLLLNAGLMLTLLLLPTTDRQIVMLNAIAVLFAAGNLFFGFIDEYRIWFELAPLALYAIDRHFFGSPLADSTLTLRLAGANQRVAR